MLQAQTKSQARSALGPYWRSAIVCLLILAGYIAIISLLHTETAVRATAPPWFSWLRLPRLRTRGQCVFLVIPLLVFAGWMGIVRYWDEGPDVHPGLLAFLFVLLMNASVACMDGSLAAIWRPFESQSEYESDVAHVHGVAIFLRDYVKNLPAYSIHARTHPPGAVLLLYFVAQLIGPGVSTAAWAAVAITASAVVPFYLLARRIAGHRTAVIAVALYAVTPSLVLFGATSMDGVFLAPLMWSVYFLERTISGRKMIHAVAAGICVAISLMFTYATVCVIAMMLIYVLLESVKSAISLIISGIVVVALLGALRFFTGFDYLACLARGRFYDHYSMHTFGMSGGRYLDISFSNLIAFLIGVGLPAVVLWGRQTVGSLKMRSSADRLNLALVVSVLGFSFGHLFTHETERIWLFFIPPVLLAAASWIAQHENARVRLLDWAMCLAFAQTWLMQVFLSTIW